MDRYGGIFERGSKEFTLHDFYALQLDKMDKYVCLKKSDVVVPTEGEEESSSDEDDGDDDEDEEDEEDGEGSGSDAPDAANQEPVEVEEDVEGKEEDVSESSNRIWLMLTCGIGYTCQSHAVFGRVERHRSISGRCYKHTTSWRDAGNVLLKIS